MCRVLYSADCRNIILFVHIFTKNSDRQNRCFHLNIIRKVTMGHFQVVHSELPLIPTIKIYPQYEHNPEKYQTNRVQTPG